MQRFSGFVFCLFALTGLVGCGSGNATLFVDNDSESSVTVEIDGERARYVGSDNNAKYRVAYGEHRVVVRQKDKVIFDQTKLFEPHAEGPLWRHYILDPHADTRYAVYEVYYYEDQAESNKNNQSRRIRGLAKTHWVDVPRSAGALYTMPFVITTDGSEQTARQYVLADK